jgi:hypothetical protein
MNRARDPYKDRLPHMNALALFSIREGCTLSSGDGPLIHRHPAAPPPRASRSRRGGSTDVMQNVCAQSFLILLQGIGPVPNGLLQRFDVPFQKPRFDLHFAAQLSKLERPFHPGDKIGTVYRFMDERVAPALRACTPRSWPPCPVMSRVGVVGLTLKTCRMKVRPSMCGILTSLIMMS